MLVSSFCVREGLGQGEHSRRVAAELTVVAADLRALQTDAVPDIQSMGLRQRIQGGMVALDILARLADQEQGRPALARSDQLVELRDDFAQNRLANVEQSIAQLRKDYPLVVPEVVIDDTAEFEKLHQSLCAACHDRPDKSVERPAYNLFTQTRATSEQDMFARMLMGVRGDRMTGIDNPLTDRQIMGLLKYYKEASIR